MAMIDDFKAKFPEFNSTKVDAAFPFLEDEYICLYDYKYDANACADKIILYLLAHLFVLKETDGTGSIKDAQSKAVGSVSVSYVANFETSGFFNFYNTTKYGQAFLMLTNKNGQGAYFV